MAGLLTTGFFPAYPDYDWNDIAAWAWGMSRCVDYLERKVSRTNPNSSRSAIRGAGSHAVAGASTNVCAGRAPPVPVALERVHIVSMAKLAMVAKA